MNYVKLFCIVLLFPWIVISQNEQISFRDLTVDHGLSQNSVVSIAQDSIGYMWFATQDGLNKYDGRTFTIYNKQFEDVTRPTFSKLGKTYIDRSGVLWIITNSGQLEVFNQENDSFKDVHTIRNASCILHSAQQDYFIGTYGNGLFKIDHKTKDTLQIFPKQIVDAHIYRLLESGSKLYLASSSGVFQIKNVEISKMDVDETDINFSSLAMSGDQTLWLGTFGKGLFYKSNNSDRFIRFNHSQLPQNLNIQDVLVDKNEGLWIATYGDGVYHLNIEKNIVQHLVANKNNPYALHYDDVLCFYEDYTGIIWLGTDGAGLSYYDKHLKKFNVITNDKAPESVNVDVVRAIVVDDEKTMWLGTSGKGLTSVNPNTNEFKTYTIHNSKLASDRIMSLLYQNDELWIGHQGAGLQLMDSKGTINSLKSLSKQTIWKIYPNYDNQIWLCTRDNGLVLFDKNDGIIETFDKENSLLTSNNIRTIEKGHTNEFWIGSENNGLFLLNTKSKKIEKINAITDNIKSLYFDGESLWIGTNGNGLKSYNTSKKAVTTYDKSHGLPNLVIYGILPGDNNTLWLSSNKGIFEFGLNNNQPTVEIYGNYSGLQAYEFNTGAYYKEADGTLYFGGLKGVNWFRPKDLTVNIATPKTVISKVKVFDKEQPIFEYSNYRYNENTITFTFSGLHFSQPERNQYKYQLVNHDSDWVLAGNTNTAHYTNLPPNDYTFKVMSSNYDMVWNTTPATYSFSILKPWYLTTISKIVYLLLGCLLLFSIYRYFKFRWEVKTQLQLEHAETERLKKLDEFKTKLYTNISHEFRTPLTLISGPIDHQLARDELDPKDREELNLVKRNANRLLNLVNQMVDLSLIDSGQLRLNVSQGNLNILLKQIVSAFQYKAEEKRIQIVSEINDLETVWFDSDILEKIASNLLSNAIKYAPRQSKIIFDANKQDDALVLTVVNTHNSLTQKDFGKLFERFYQGDSNSEGVGVGLALVKELVTLSKGSIIANNIDADQLQFTVTLPIHRQAFQPSELKLTEDKEDIIDQKMSKIKNQTDQPVVLIVEDDNEIRKFIMSMFSENYEIIEATDGNIGIEKALEYIPDLIISDIMMPVKDGISLCNELKYNALTSHIPIILLTAKVGEENEIEGLRTGADAYITKPFSSEKLKLRVEKLIENRAQLQKHFSKDFSIHPELAVTSTEAEFLNRLKLVMETHITDPEFSSEQFAEVMLMSRTQLHRKLKAIFGKSSSEIIRLQRLKLSLHLLHKSDATIAEIAYQIGFNTPSYFIKCFKDVYNCTPSEYSSAQ
ncbi:MAG: hybrid sensor histidine kinase/response regulator transcription factor [Aquaticitalea sp.]